MEIFNNITVYSGVFFLNQIHTKYIFYIGLQLYMQGYMQT